MFAKVIWLPKITLLQNSNFLLLPELNIILWIIRETAPSNVLFAKKVFLQNLECMGTGKLTQRTLCPNVMFVERNLL